MQYCVAANYYWLLVEGVYLYTLLALSVFSEQRVFRLYLTIGWGKAHSHSSHPALSPHPVVWRWGEVGRRPWPLFKLLPSGYPMMPSWYSTKKQGPLDNSLQGIGLNALETVKTL